MKTNIEESYILREYFKGFRPQPVDLVKIKEKINKVNRESILSLVIDQDNQIYNLIAENYQNTYEILDKITEHINSLNLKKKNSSKNLDDVYYQFRYNNSDDEETNNTTMTINNSDNISTEPVSIVKINMILNQNRNKLQQYSNEITARNNIIKKKKKSIEEKQKYLDEIQKEKDFYIENLDEKYVITEMINNNQYEILKLLFTKYISIPQSEISNENDTQLSQEEKKFVLIQNFNKLSPKEIKKELSKIDSEKFINFSYDRLTEIKKNINEISKNISESEKETDKENDFFYFLIKALRGIIDVANTKNEIIIENELINQETETIENINDKIKELKVKIQNFQIVKKEILNKYENSNSTKIKRQPTNKSSGSKNESFVSKKSEESNKEDINELKLLISQMENNYVALLKNLSKKIIKPKNLIRRPDANFLQSKIK